MRQLARYATIFTLATALFGFTAGMLTTEEARQIREGMSQSEVVEQYGKPIDINTTRTRGTVRQEYVYRSEQGGYDRVCVYFEDYVVTSVQH